MLLGLWSVSEARPNDRTRAVQLSTRFHVLWTLMLAPLAGGESALPVAGKAAEAPPLIEAGKP